MNKSFGLVDRPQFNTVVFTEGKAFHIIEKYTNGTVCQKFDCIVLSSNPIKLTIAYYDKDEKELITFEAIRIEDVISGRYTILPLCNDNIYHTPICNDTPIGRS